MVRARNLVFVMLLLAVPLFAQKATVPLPSPSGFNAFSPQQEIEIGRENAAQVAKQYPLLPESDPITQYVQQLGHKLVEQLPQPTYPFTFHVIREKDINAFALPGGPVYVNLGSIQACSNEAQLAGVLAHEISHVYMRHSTNEATKKIAPELGLGIIGAIFGGSIGGQLAQLAGQFAVGSAFMHYSRAAESQADHVGAQIMYDAGYDPYQLALFFAKLDEEGGSRGSQFFSDHPNPGNRSQAIRTEIQQFPPKHFVVNSTEFDRIHQLAMKERTYTAKQIQSGDFSRDTGQQQRSGHGGRGEQQGEDQGGPVPVPSANGELQTLEHNGYSIRYPSDWRAYGDPQSPVTIAPENGIVNNAVAYGAIINNFQPPSGTGLDDATQQLIQSLKQSNPALKTIGKSEKITVNGVHGFSVDMIGQSPLADRDGGQPQRERDWLVTLPRNDGSIDYTIFIAPDQEFMSLRPTFEQMLRSWHLK